MKQRTFLVVALGLAAVLIAGGLYASNMAFKLNYPLAGDLNPASSSGQNSIALPYNAQTGIGDAKNLLDDINLASSPGNVLQVAEWRRDQDGFVGYTGTSGSPFPLVPGDAYLVQVTNDVSYIIVGSHDPGLQLNFLGDADPGSSSGQNYYSYPYHSTSGDAKQLLDEVNAHAGSSVVLQVAQWQEDQDGFVGYTGTSGSPFALIPGEGYLVQTTINVNNFVPSHF